MLSIFKRKKKSITKVEDNVIVAIANATQIPIEDVKDEMFAQKILGEGIAFVLQDDVIYAPANGTLTVLYPTGHAFGITMKDGVELLCHIGINTVESKGDGFTLLTKQGESVSAGQPIIKLNLSELQKQYDMTTMLIVTDSHNLQIEFYLPKQRRQGEIVGRINETQ